MEAVGTRNLKHFVYDDSWKMRFEKNRKFQKDTQIQIYKPKVEGNAYEIQKKTNQPVNHKLLRMNLDKLLSNKDIIYIGSNV